MLASQMLRISVGKAGGRRMFESYTKPLRFVSMNLVLVWMITDLL